jgi:hypothetical protein
MQSKRYQRRLHSFTSSRTIMDYPVGQRPVFNAHPSQLLLSFRSPRNIAAVAVGTAAAAGIAWYLLKRPRPTAEEIERTRRDLLASTGRITDGSITDVSMTPQDAPPTPQIIIYNYRIAGVSYECGQVVTALAEHVRDIRIDLPIQVRYDPHNPADSIVVAESWSGLRLGLVHPHSDGAGHVPVEESRPQAPTQTA